MTQATLIVYDYDLDYITYFLDYFTSKETSFFKIQAFTEEDNFRAFLESHKDHVDVLLVSDRLQVDEYMSHVPLLIILTEEENGGIFGGDLAINKYQSMENIMRELVEAYLKVQSNSQIKKSYDSSYNRNGKTYIIGVCSLYSSLIDTLLSFGLGVQYGKSKKVLYLNFEAYEIFSIITGSNKHTSLSDLVYYLKQENSNVIMKISTLIKTIKGIDCIFGIEKEYDLYDISPVDIQKLCDILVAEAGYDLIMIQFDPFHPTVTQFFEQCDLIYMIKGTPKGGELKEKKFLDLIQSSGEEGFLFDKIELISIPDSIHTSLDNINTYDMNQLLTSNLNDYISTMVEQEEEINS